MGWGEGHGLEKTRRSQGGKVKTPGSGEWEEVG